jgi:hypothetical protein
LAPGSRRQSSNLMNFIWSRFEFSKGSGIDGVGLPGVAVTPGD